MKNFSVWFALWLCFGLHMGLGEKTKSTSTSTSTSTTSSTDNARVKLTLDPITLDNGAATSATEKASTTVPVKMDTEDSYDKELVKLVFRINDDGYYYNTNMSMGNEEMGLRLDLIQPEVWVMNNKDFYDCSYIDEWYASEVSEYGSSMPALVTDASQYVATACAQQGAYSMESGSSGSIASPTKSNVYNNQPYSIPYLNSINVSGVFATDNFSFIISDSKKISLKDFTFVNADEANVLVGGLGLAGNPTGSGFLDSLVANDIIGSVGYSLWFNNYSDSKNAVAELIPGMVDNKYYSGDFFEFDIPDHEASQYSLEDSTLIDNLKLPILPLSDVEVENQNDHKTLSLKSDSQNFAVLLDSRTVFNYLPLYMIVNLAIQTNASYSSEVNRWVVECDQISNLNATLNFKFGDLRVKVPLDDFLISASYNNRNLTFATGKRACYLSFLPSSVSGFTALGIPFLRAIYLAVDYEGGKIAVANSNHNLDVKIEDYSNTKKVEHYSTSLAHLESETSGYLSNHTIHNSIAYIESGKIPFATKYNSTENFTLTYVPLNFTKFGDPSIPAILSGIIIKSGDIFVTASDGLTTTDSQSSSKANSANRIEPPVIFDKNLSNKLISLGVGIFTCIVCIIFL
ncbi:uncharacterized protein AC631_03374 [Debaryomyces fabryi]|uniref:Peptidase A1 domain-containing protein n=1 Tax=Debaryomyces fabryi TaxID=58627 RepID=A0A0V1PX88_9ASCO|nr:uncharacterized protein AC631_03374 [Debaryomyces fabryi]KSA00889.1 hypothetical protein AC631_03374 [Debaryomyces fabryi]CUM46085.1 unnamed protein product [Debaryomyces fabryi]